MCVGTMKTDFMSFFQDQIKERLKKDPKLDGIGMLYLICVMQEQEVPNYTIVEKIKEILAVRVSEDEKGREEFMDVISDISAKYTNQWIEEYFSLKNKKPELDARASWDENPETAHCQKAIQDIIESQR